MEGTLGEIRMFAGSFAPKNWAFCDGQQLQIKTNNALFLIIGAVYGGDGKNTFYLPDFRGRMPIGQGQGKGLLQRTIGEKGGVETITLTEANMPPHKHGFMVSTLPTATPAVNKTNLAKDSILGDYPAATPVYYKKTTGDALTKMHPDVISTVGDSKPHTNMPPFLGINFIICLIGDFPQKDK